MAENEEHNRSHTPLLGVVLCCTSVLPEKRSDLASIAAQMGADHKLDLTSDVTHLIVGEVSTPKYMYVAKERPDIKCLLPEWVEAVRQSWMEGGEIDLEALENQYKVPAFMGLRVCVTGFADLDYRRNLETLITTNGGTFKGDLNSEVTHLIAHVPSGNKYKFAGQWGVKVVSVEWLQQSLERGMILDETLFHPTTPLSERGRGALVRRVVSPSSLGKRGRADAEPNLSRKLRRTASAKLNSENSGLWTDIVGNGPGQEDPGLRSRGTSETGHQAMNPPGVQPVVAESFADSDTVGRVARNDIAVPKKTSSLLEVSPPSKALFYGKSFYLHGFDSKKTSVLQNHLLSHDAKIVSDFHEFSQSSLSSPGDPGYLIVPHTSSNHDIPSTPDTLPQPVVVTELWIERCLHRKNIITPNTHVINTPFRRFPIPGFEKLAICSTGFDGVDLLHMSKAVRLMGATYDGFLTPNITMLVCDSNSGNSEKLRHAAGWGIQTVTAQWLWDCIRSGDLRSPSRYGLSSDNARQAKNSENTSLQRPNGEGFMQRQQLKAGNLDRRLDNLESSRSSGPKPSLSRTMPPVGAPGTSSNNLPSETMSLKSKRTETSSDDIQKANKAPTTIRIDGETVFPADETLQPTHEDSKTPLYDDPRDDTPILVPTQPLPPKIPPLTPISPNITPRPSASPTKSVSSTANPTQDQASLSSAITALLEHHQQRTSASTIQQITKPEPGPPFDNQRRSRRRHLLGRAPSNLSARTLDSRASSIDTMNTDGLGTPLEGNNTSLKSKETIMNPPPAAAAAPKKTSIDIEAMLSEFCAPPRDQAAPPPEEPLQMTQLGYEDPEVMEWREKVVSRMRGGRGAATAAAATGKGAGGEAGGGGAQRISVTGTVKDDVVGRGAGSIARRTRQAGLR